MSGRTLKETAPAKKAKTARWFLLGLALLSGLLAISGGSLWIDEGNSAFRAMQPTLPLFWKSLVTGGGSDAQMPLYMLYLWSWEKLFGAGEWQLRASNLPLWLLANGALLTTAERLRPFSARVARMSVFLACLSPFLWQYLDEARPYIMQFSGGTLLLCFLLELNHDTARIFRTSTIWKAALGVIFLAGGSLLGVFWVIAGGMAALILLWQSRAITYPKRHRIEKGAVLLAATSSIILLALGLYYLHVMEAGGGASRQGNTIGNLGFIVYEMTGFSGLGPGRLALRNGPAGDTLKPFIPWLAAGAVCIGVPILAAGYQQFRRAGHSENEVFPRWLLIYCLPLSVTLLAGIASGVRVLGRHMIPGFPVVLWALAALLISLRFDERSHLRRTWLLLPLAWIVSATQFRWSDKPQRDEYRFVAQAARAALDKGQSVLWAADHLTGIYYKLPLNDSAQFRTIANPTEDPLAFRPNLVICSRPDIYDAHGQIQEAASRHNYRVIAQAASFTVYERPGETAE